MNTNVTEALDRAGITFTLKEHTEPALTCESAAKERGVRVSQIVKCMVGESDEGQLIAMLIPGDRTLKSSKVRKRLKLARLDLVDSARLAKDFGLTVGAISPVELLFRAAILMDPSVLEEEIVAISSGDPLAGIELKSADLSSYLGAELVDMVSTRSH